MKAKLLGILIGVILVVGLAASFDPPYQRSGWTTTTNQAEAISALSANLSEWSSLSTNVLTPGTNDLESIITSAAYTTNYITVESPTLRNNTGTPNGWAGPIVGPTLFDSVQVAVNPIDSAITKVRLKLKWGHRYGSWICDLTNSVTTSTGVRTDTIFVLPRLILNREADAIWMEWTADNPSGRYVVAAPLFKRQWTYYSEGSDMGAALQEATEADTAFTEFAAFLVRNTNSIVMTRYLIDQVADAAALKYNDQVLEPLRISVPSYWYSAEGSELNVYFNNVVRGALSRNVQFNVDCPTALLVGRQYERNFRVVPTAALAGTHAWKLDVLSSSNVLMSATNVLNVATNTQGTGVSRRLLVIGDSTVVNGSLVSEINRMMGTNSTYTLTLIGKGGGGGGTNWHEGFDNRRWEYLKQVALSRFAKVDGTFDFNYYLTNNSLTMESGDWVVFQLGINDIFSWSTNDALVTERLSLTQSNVYTIVTNINGVVPGIRVGIAVTIPPAESADGLGVSNGTGIDLPRYRRSLHRLNEMYCGWEGWLSIYLVPIHANLDAQNSFPLGNQVVNGRSEVQRPWILDTIHPGSVGYSQMADTYYAFLKWHQ